MVIKLDGNVRIENLRNYPEETVEKLRALLAAGAEAQADPRRRDFYDVRNGARVFFIHISPHTRKVMLLGIWPSERQAIAVAS